jgi:hypothetical protein
MFMDDFLLLTCYFHLFSLLFFIFQSSKFSNSHLYDVYILLCVTNLSQGMRREIPFAVLDRQSVGTAAGGPGDLADGINRCVVMCCCCGYVLRFNKTLNI